MRRPDLPTGTVTLVFTDIAGSTKLLSALGRERYAHELQGHRETLRSVFARHDGIEVGTQGDACFYVFPTASQALDATNQGLAALQPGLIRIRVGIHSGSPLLTEEGYVGEDVHRASRIASAGSGGQALVSSTTAALINPDQFELVDLGIHQLKDLARPDRIYQLGSGSFPPIRSLSPSNLPIPTTPFLGRRSELERITVLLSDPGVRLLTLTGPGGTGKTRLAIQAAAESGAAFPDGQWWLSLAALSDPKLVLPALASTLGIDQRAENSADADLVTRLRGGKSLILLDNAEHLLPQLAIELGDVLPRAEGATFLVTSRAPLHVDAERELPIPAMSEADAELFIVTRAYAVGVEVKPSPSLGRLCNRLDRLPLAMQLAASRLKLFSVEQLESRLTHLIDLPGHRDAVKRQVTLRATIEWSDSLLTPEERTAFRRFTVFVGGATVDAVE